MSNTRHVRQPDMPLEAAAIAVHWLLQTALPAHNRAAWLDLAESERQQTRKIAQAAVNGYRRAGGK